MDWTFIKSVREEYQVWKKGKISLCENLLKKVKVKSGGGEEYQVVGNFIHPFIYDNLV